MNGMKGNNRRRMKKDKKGMESAIPAIIIIIVAAFVVGTIIYNGIHDNWKMLRNIFEKYGPPKINDKTAFLYTIDDFTLGNAADVGCTELSAAGDSAKKYTCPAGKDVKFIVSVENGGTRMRKISCAIVVCNADCRGTTCTEAKGCSRDVSASGTESYLITKEETMECDAGTYKLEANKKYIIYPVAICALQSEIGCYSPTIPMREPDKIFNPGKPIYITTT